MAANRRFRENLRASRKVFATNWGLFKASRVGVIGLGVMIAFVLMALLAPFMNLRDPIRWVAPSSDTLDTDPFWTEPGLIDTPNSFFGNLGRIETSPAFRVYPSADNANADRVYIASGTRLYAIRSWTPSSGWESSEGSSYINLTRWSPGVVSTNPVLVNYGDYSGSLRQGEEKYPEYILYVGMSDGRVIAFRDSFSRDVMVNPDSPAARRPGPKAAEVWNTTVDGNVTGIAVFTPDMDYERSGGERVAIATDKGKLYVYGVGAGFWDLADPLDTPVPHTLIGRWNETNQAPLSLADGPMRGVGSLPQWSPAFNHTGQGLAVGSARGRIHFLSVGSVGPDSVTEDWNLTAVPGATDYRSAPVIAASEQKPPHDGAEIVYAAGREGWVFPRYLNGSLIAGWDRGDFLIPPVGGLPTGGTFVGRTNQDHQVISPDAGRFAQPAVAGSNVFLASTTGCIYTVRVVGTGVDAANGSVQWFFCEELRDVGFAPEFRAAPLTLETNAAIMFGAAIKKSPENTTQTNGVFYSLRMDTGAVQYRLDFEDEVMTSRPIAWSDPENIGKSVWFIGSGPRSAMHSFAVSGRVTIPSEPSWAHQYTDEQGDLKPGYKSGNQYWLGLDSRGRDIFSQLVWGSRIALLVGFLAAFFTVLIGMVIGLLAGYLGGRIDSLLMRFTDVILVIPGLPLIIIMASVLGSSIWNIILVIALVGWPGVARVIRAEVLSLKERPFIESARVTGASPSRIMFRHIAPNVMPLAFLFMTFGVSGAILSEAALSFIGLGDVNTMSWGIMLYYVQNSNALKSWWWLLPPGLAITLISLAFFLVGRAFDEIVNPRLRKR